MAVIQRKFLGVRGKTALDVARDQEIRDTILHRGSSLRSLLDPQHELRLLAP